ncbi:Biotin carboxyl carrier protein of acetyl-CoA carboxylase [[Actinomadura] parvosata subsp. kistnae]|uniref:acetyl-CoA carboxylase biotin carboxyl carrier protein n=1 Tax=[Actinomadura] parvosata TaxID=1955412 RepID=UPI0009AE7E0C|nr:biotin/lipoyl-containing protein [Nonomuraea sp. ATCC 55076]SPL89770.1 Biotin carboxyl carrier protein of acetyl-CoA carboxylase [Actinomadura parvosata subsp. kistnae]
MTDARQPSAWDGARQPGATLDGARQAGTRDDARRPAAWDGAPQPGPWDGALAELGVRDAVAILCQGLAEAVHASPRSPSRACVRLGGASIEVEWSPVVAGEPAPEPPAEQPDEEPPGHVVRAELVGTFYRQPEPGAKPFVEVGDLVEANQQVAIVEAMKLMNPVLADVGGRVARILVGDAEGVEYDQPLIVIEPGTEPDAGA